MTKNKRLTAFTLAEVLITLGVIGVVAAVTMPALVTNIQERVRKEQVRTVKYKLTKATDKMNSLGKIGVYGDDDTATSNFLNELKKHLSIAKICDNNHLTECWSGNGFINANGSKTYNVADLKTGKDLDALQFNSGATKTMGIVTGDGVPIILVYGKECEALDEAKTYTWSTIDGKPETNATAGCVSMVFDINGKKGPNKLGTDVRTMNSLLGMVNILGSRYASLTQAECTKYKNELGITNCFNGWNGTDYSKLDEDKWAGAVKACHDLGLHLPSMATLAKIATLQLGIQVDVLESVDILDDCSSYTSYRHCKEKPIDYDSYSTPISITFNGHFWSGQEYSSSNAYTLSIVPASSTWANSWVNARIDGRSNGHYALCIAD